MRGEGAALEAIPNCVWTLDMETAACALLSSLGTTRCLAPIDREGLTLRKGPNCSPCHTSFYASPLPGHHNSDGRSLQLRPHCLQRIEDAQLELSCYWWRTTDPVSTM